MKTVLLQYNKSNVSEKDAAALIDSLNDFHSDIAFFLAPMTNGKAPSFELIELKQAKVKESPLCDNPDCTDPGCSS